MITSIQLVNFKCFRKQNINFGPLTLLSGLNGTGKSSVIQALLLLRQSFRPAGENGAGLILNGDLVRLGTGQDVLFEGAPDEFIELKVALAANGRKGLFYRCRAQYRREGHLLEAAVTRRGRIDRLPLFGLGFQYLTAERIGPRTYYEFFDSQTARRVGNLGSRGEFTANFLDRFGDHPIPNTSLSHPKGHAPQLLRQIEAWMGELAPGIRLELAPHTSLDVIALQYSFESGKYVSNNYRSTNVGFGLTYTLPILTAVLASPPGSLLLIENPEAHLHPKGQFALGKLFGMAAHCGVQVVVETHSDHVVNGVRVAVHDGLIAPEKVQIHFFERRNTGELSPSEVVSPVIDRDGRLDYWPEDFFDEWEKSLDVLLEPAEV
jgi:predicted ATPase